MQEKERYLSFKGEYQQSAEVGREAIKKLPKDRDVVVYLGYDLLNLQQYDELLQLTAQYETSFPRSPTFRCWPAMRTNMLDNRIRRKRTSARLWNGIPTSSPHT